MPEIPVVDEQEFDYDAAIEEVAACITMLQDQSDAWGKANRSTAFRSAVQDAIHLLLGYADDLAAQKERVNA